MCFLMIGKNIKKTPNAKFFRATFGRFEYKRFGDY